MYEALSYYQCMRSLATTSVRGLKLPVYDALVYEAFSYQCMRPSAKLLVYEALSYWCMRP